MPAHRFTSLLRIAASLLLLGPCAGHAAELIATRGDVQVQRDRVTLASERGTQLRTGDVIVTAPGADAVVRLDDGGRLAVRPDATVQLARLADPAPGGSREEAIRLVRGALRYVSSVLAQKNAVRFDTITASVGIRGTDIEISFADLPVRGGGPGTYLKVNTGAATLTALDGSAVPVEAGQVAYGAVSTAATRAFGPLGRRLETVPPNAFPAGGLDDELR
jgi:hypothetical protein